MVPKNPSASRMRVWSGIRSGGREGGEGGAEEEGAAMVALLAHSSIALAFEK